MVLNPDAQSRFSEDLIRVNGFDPAGFKCWVFCEGMLFGAADKWWGDLGERDFWHEGLDFCLYRGRDDRLHRLDATTRIPVIWDGRVVAMFKDYLGVAVIVEHHLGGRKTPFLSVYAHTTPRADLAVGTTVQSGRVIASIADTRNSKAKILPHLHLSLGRPSAGLSYDGFYWNLMRDPNRMTLIDPLASLDWPHAVLAGPPPAI